MRENKNEVREGSEEKGTGKWKKEKLGKKEKLEM